MASRHDTDRPILPGPDGAARLTRRQVEVLQLAACGLRYKHIATHLGISSRTVQDRFREMRERTGARTRDELLVYAVKAGLTPPAAEIPPGRRTIGPRRSKRHGQRHDEEGHAMPSMPRLGEGDGAAGPARHTSAANYQAQSVPAEDVLGALQQVAKERGRLDHAERALIDVARRRGATWQKIGHALGLGSPQAAQQRRKRLSKA